MHKTTIFIIQLCVVVELFSLKDECGFIAETASFYVTVESGVNMRKVNIWKNCKYLHGDTYVE